MEIGDISTILQNQIIVKRLFDSGYDANGILGLEIEDLKKSTVYDQCNLLSEGKELKSKAGPGRPSKYDDEDILLIMDYITENQDAYVLDIVKYLKDTTGKNISDFTVRRVLKEEGYVYKEPEKASFLPETKKPIRVQWAYNHTHCNWNKVLFTDEATFWLGKSGVARWKPLNEANIHMVPKDIPKLQVWGAFPSKGKISLKIFRNDMTTIIYRHIRRKVA